jgi:hypothetical protein
MTSDSTIGRPSKYSQELSEKFCKRLAMGEAVLQICADPDMPSRETIYNWLKSNPEFLDSYTQARSQQADAYAEQIVIEAFNSHDAQIGRLRVDALKWAAAKIAPKKYGDKIEVETSQPLTLAFQLPSRAPERVQLESNERSLEE